MNDTYPAKYRNYVKAGVAARKIDLVLGEYVVEFPPSGSGELVFKSGKKLNAGLIVSSSRRPSLTNSTGRRKVATSGPKPNTGFIGQSLGPEALAENKLVKVEKTLQLPSHPEIFAVGDIIDWKEQKQAAKANGHAPVVVANVVDLLASRPARKEYGGFPEMIMITNGKVRKFRPLLVLLLSLIHFRHHRTEGLHTFHSFGESFWVTLSRHSSSRRVC